MKPVTIHEYRRRRFIFSKKAIMVLVLKPFNLSAYRTSKKQLEFCNSEN